MFHNRIRVGLRGFPIRSDYRGGDEFQIGAGEQAGENPAHAAFLQGAGRSDNETDFGGHS